ncbi:hypothetical protein F0L68_16295 [Solihabitans fulvus]|uniref:Uncharacterized protein n=1 Tax=Solihabitans fulvus TaxID=1892852 RepID=A0A5B2XEU3_9PSEU|nr:hypothetical protein [Solihabitans fulvus]KAA2261634.1 hypothetical protein F0L68_16295 [Solihabitans fulvus]
MEVSFAEDSIRFLGYDFLGSTVHPAGVVTVPQLRDADWIALPLEVVTTSGETLFVPSRQRVALQRFCRHNDVPHRQRPDVWGDLLEPFLDTSFTVEHEIDTETRLREAGLRRDEVADIRGRLTPLMNAYNFDSMLWEWCYLGLFDLLRAANGHLVPPDLPPTLGDPTAFYAWTMSLAERHPGVA